MVPIHKGYLENEQESGITISHLFFANDTLVFCNVSQEQMTFLCWLMLF